MGIISNDSPAPSVLSTASGCDCSGVPSSGLNTWLATLRCHHEPPWRCNSADPQQASADSTARFSRRRQLGSENTVAMQRGSIFAEIGSMASFLNRTRHKREQGRRLHPQNHSAISRGHDRARAATPRASAPQPSQAAAGRPSPPLRQRRGAGSGTSDRDGKDKSAATHPGMAASARIRE